MFPGDYGFDSDVNRTIDEAAESSDKWQQEIDANREFMKRAFKIDEDKKELPHLFVEYLEKNNMKDILEQVGQVRTWDDLKNKIEIIQSKDPQMSLRIMNLFSKFQKTPR